MQTTQRIRNRLFALVTSLALGLFVSGAQADDVQAPDVLVKTISQDVMTSVKADADIQAGNIKKINDLVEAKILPYVDFQKMTSAAVGRFWSGASADQKTAITREFRTLLIYTYAGALSQVKNQTIEYRPLRADPADTDVEVKSRVLQPQGEPIQLNYRLTRTAAGWKIIDVNVLGVWLVETYRASFASEINKSGVDGLIKSLTDKNQMLAKSLTQKPAKG